MNIFTAVTVINVSIIAMIGFAIYHTNSCYPLLALFFMAFTSSKKEDSE